MNAERTEASPEDLAALEVLREKYREERDRRIRADGTAQYQPIARGMTQYSPADPHCLEPIVRDPMFDEFEILVIGGGFSGLAAGVHLREAGMEFRMLDGASDFGGVWYWNRYPGAQCDTESYIYLPLLEELGYMPTQKYTDAKEIFEHAQRIARGYDLYRDSILQTNVTEMNWDEERRRWIVKTDRGDELAPRFVVVANGGISRPKLPNIPGIDNFKGRMFHTQRWDYDYTGGSSEGNMVKLRDKKVAVIGTGATGIQCIPFIAQDAGHLYVFQRTPSAVGLRGNSKTDVEWFNSQESGWQERRRANFADVTEGHPFDVDLVHDAWSDLHRNFQYAPPLEGETPEQRELRIEIADMHMMNGLRERVDDIVKDKATAEALKPWYRRFCKRPAFNDEYLESFNRPNVTLVDTSPSKGVERITETGIVANGVEYEVDCIVFATGFELSKDFRQRFGFEINGRDGKSLFDSWNDNARTLHGFMTTDFPNWFYMGVFQNSLAFNMTTQFDEQGRHIAYILSELHKRGATFVEPTEEAVQGWVNVIRTGGASPGRGNDFTTACTPGFYNAEGHPEEGGVYADTYAHGLNAFNAVIQDWRKSGELPGLIVK